MPGNINRKGFIIATGAYLFRQIKDGKKKPIEVEYLTDQERHDVFIHRTSEELINWINLLCDVVAAQNPPETHEVGHSIAKSMNDPSAIQEAAYRREEEAKRYEANMGYSKGTRQSDAEELYWKQKDEE